MTVKDAIAMLAYGTAYKAIGASSGKKLFDYRNKKETQAKYYDCETPDDPFFCELEISRKHITHSVEMCRPIIGIWVSGK